MSDNNSNNSSGPPTSVEDSRKVISLKGKVPSEEELRKAYELQQQRIQITAKHSLLSFLESLKDGVLKDELIGIMVIGYSDKTLPAVLSSGKIDGPETLLACEQIKQTIVKQLSP